MAAFAAIGEVRMVRPRERVVVAVEDREHPRKLNRRHDGVRMDLSAEDEQRLEEEVRCMVAALRARPTQEKEDALGLEIARLPAAEREHVTAVLLRMLGEGRGEGR